MGESSRKRRRGRSRSRSRSRARSSSASRDERSKKSRRHHTKRTRRSRSRSSDLSDRRSRSRSRSARRSGREHDRDRSSRRDTREKRERKKDHRRRRSRTRSRSRSRSRSASRPRSSKTKDKDRKRRTRRHSRSRSRSQSPVTTGALLTDVGAADALAVPPTDQQLIAPLVNSAATVATAVVSTLPEALPVAAATTEAVSATATTAAAVSSATAARPSQQQPSASRRSRSADRTSAQPRAAAATPDVAVVVATAASTVLPTTATAATAVAAAPKRVSTAEAATTFQFGGIAIKTDRLKNVGTSGTNSSISLKAPLRKSPLDISSSTKTDAKTSRLEKLARWKAQQLQLKRIEAQQFLAEDDAVPKQLTLWSPSDDADTKSETSVERQQREAQEAQQRERVQKVVEEVDPLDAYMAGLVDEAAIQQSIVNPAANVISRDEIALAATPKINIYGTFLPPDSADTGVATVGTRSTVPLADTNGSVVGSAGSGAAAELPIETSEEREAREERELHEFMRALKAQREQEAASAANDPAIDATTVSEEPKRDTGRIYQGFEEDAIGETAASIDTRSALEILQEAQKKKEIKAVDHSQIQYIPFQKKFYVVPKEIRDMSDAEVDAIRQADEIKIRGKSCPRPIKKWTQCGFSVRMLQLLQKHGYAEPFAIQRQALPAIMAGRDVIGIAKTGSGKTLAFLLPMFRHILHQPPLLEGEGPIGLVMAPARELAQQIYVEAKRFAKGLGMRATAVYGGSSVSEQIGNLKRGSDIVICTPGRMIDILTMSAGKMVSLQRVTYVVLDEADRMFDMGFEPQITKIMLNIRSDRQTLLFSATFPRAVETLARRVLRKPVEITVGGRSQASGDITQYVEVRDESDKFMRLLQLLGLWYEKGNILVFVNTQQACDQVFQDLMKAGYPALSLHGGKDQVDRDYTIDDFKRKVRSLMVATSVAGRGLDVKDLVLVINYHCPNHLEDYVHRVGRTGRAGRKGTAFTFISPEEEEYSVDLVKALEAAKQVVPPELVALADGFKDKVKRGEARYHGSGFKGKGFTFDESERNETQRVMDLQKRQYEIDQGIVVEDAGGDDDDADDAAKDAPSTDSSAPPTSITAATSTAKLPLDSASLSAVKKAQQIAQILELQYKQTQAHNAAAADASDDHFEDELEINDYPQQARWRVTQKEASDSISELTGAAVIARGSFVPAGRKPNPGERKLYLRIEGATRAAVLDARRELQRILDETTLQVGLGGDKYGKYNL